MHKNPYLRDVIALSLDIETVQRDDELARQIVADGIKPSGNMSKPETLSEWHATRKPALVEEALAKGAGALSPVTGKIICIGLVSPTHEQIFASDDEHEVIRLAYEFIQSLGEPIVLVGHAIQGFDLPFLRCRSIVHGLRPPLSVAKAWRAKPWDGTVGDTMALWNPDREKRISLDKLCQLLGIDSPKANGMDGSQVYGLYKAGEWQKIGDYCLADARAALACYQRIQAVV